MDRGFGTLKATLLMRPDLGCPLEAAGLWLPCGDGAEAEVGSGTGISRRSVPGAQRLPVNSVPAAGE